MLKASILRNVFVTIALIAVAASFCSPQVTTGTPPYRSFGGGPDVINLGNLNVHYSIPVFSRAGRGTPFSYALAYDSSIWSISAGAWLPKTNWGLLRDTAALVGYVGLRTVHGTCNIPTGGTADVYNWYFGPYVDPAGTTHALGLHVNYRECDENADPTGHTTIGDGTGIKVDTDMDTVKLTLKSGEVITPQTLSSGVFSGDGVSVDGNGNKITTSTTNGTTTITDTLGTTALTITGTAPSPVYYKYTAPSGALASVTVTYATYTVRTYFQCSGINEYGPLSKSLVDKITLPDGSYYQFGYETTPGDTNSPHHVTGRVASVR